MYSTTMTTFNCKNVKTAVSGIKKLCSYADIIALQETWLLAHDLEYLAEIDENFGSTGTTAVDPGTLLKGRPFGGVALMWRKSVFPCVSVIQCANPRIAAIRITTNDRPVLVLSVYMPTNRVKNLAEFTDCLSTVSAIIEESDVESVFILGDFNAHPGKLFYHELLKFCQERTGFVRT